MAFSLPVVLKRGAVLLIGGGKVAAQKAAVLTAQQVPFTVIAERLDTAFRAPEATMLLKTFEACDLKGFDIVIDATGNPRVTEVLLQRKREHGFLLNVVDVPHHCDFYFAALTTLGTLQVAVSSNGASPTMAQVVRDKIAAFLPKSLEALSQQCAAARREGVIDPASTRAQTEAAFREG